MSKEDITVNTINPMIIDYTLDIPSFYDIPFLEARIRRTQASIHTSIGHLEYWVKELEGQISRIGLSWAIDQTDFCLAQIDRNEADIAKLQADWEQDMWALVTMRFAQEGGYVAPGFNLENYVDSQM